MFRLKSVAALTLMLGIGACTGDAGSPLGPDGTQPLATISDAAHAGAVPGFYFLPPMVPNPSYSGTFDSGLDPRVEICELVGTTCGAVIAQYTEASGTGGEMVQTGTSSYQVNWHTNQFNLDPAKHYRISVYVGTFRLGFADVDVVSSGNQLKNVDTDEYIALKDGRTLPIKFRIETGIAAQVIVSPDSAEIAPGETQQFTATVLDLHGNTLACTPTWTSSNPAVATVDASGLATGVAPGSTIITATCQAASGSATLIVVDPNTPPVAQDDAFEAIGNVTVPVAAPGVLANDTDGEGDALQAVPGTFATASGGTVTVNADGSFSYLSAAGFTGEDSFAYTVTDGQDSATATVTMTSAYRVWYVDNAAAPGDGRDASPFNTLAEAEAVSTAGETILIRTGAAPYDGGITLKTAQSLTGQGVPANVTATLNGQTVVLLAAGAAPTVTRTTAGPTVQLATDNVVQGVNVTSTAGAGIAGTGFGTLTVGSTAVAATGGPALDLSAGDVVGSFNALSSAGSTGAGIRLVGVGGSFSAAGGSITGSAGAGADVTGGAGTFTYGGDIAVAGPLAVSVTGRTGGTLTFGGTIASTGNGISVQNNSGGTIAFTGGSKSLSTGTNPGVSLTNNAGATISFGGGGLAIGTTTGTGFLAADGGTVTVTGAGNTVSSAGGVAVHVKDVTIAATGITFRSVSADGGTSGIVLRNTSGPNTLQVTGTGVAGSGGLIQSTSGRGIELEDVNGVSFAYMTISATGGSGVGGTGVTDFAFTNGTIQSSGTAMGAGDSNIGFNAGPMGTASNLDGTVTISGNTLSSAYQHGIDIVNYSGTLSDVTITNNAVTSSISTAASTGSGIRLVARGSGAATAHLVRASITGNVVRNFPNGAGIQVEGGNTTAGGPVATVGVPGNATNVIAITGNRVSGQAAARMGSGAIVTIVSGRAQGNFDISGNGTAADPLGYTAGTTIQHSALGQVTVKANIANNYVVANNSFGSQGIGVGADQAFAVTDAPNLEVAITGNAITTTDGNGILAGARNSVAVLRARVENNVVAMPLAGVRQGIRIDAGTAAGNATVCLQIAGNQSAGSGSALGIGLRKQGTNPAVNVFGIDGMVATATPGVEAYVNAQNPAGGGTQLLSATSGFSNCSL
ncbi:beta strand repeat-containing protein [Longimicrobium sp.]|uniref:beta strand repeat-containing protein n=1 Tax=Longimicrobium sp. TaxID=2029185 RepID=UPI003B3A58ED